MDRSLQRMIDANANRAREAARVVEDVARFALDHRQLSEASKQLRHDLAAAIAEFPPSITARDTPGDVGTSITTPAETQRDGVRGIAAAACKRMTEAIRVLEEASKPLNGSARTDASAPPLPKRLEQLRYRAYELERRLQFAIGSSRREQWPLCVLITDGLCEHHACEQVARLAIEGGADCLQLREKSLTDRELLDRARTLRAITREHNAALVINDRPDIAQLVSADGVHVGQNDLPVDLVRRLVGLEMLIGVSCTSPEQARCAIDAGADYLGLGPMFPTTTKPHPGGRTDGSLAGPALIEAVLGTGHPHLAIGGIDASNAAEVCGAGARGIAVSAAVCAAPNPADAARELRAIVTAHAPSPTPNEIPHA